MEEGIMAQITVNVGTDKIRFTVTINSGDESEWVVDVCSTKDHGKGDTPYPDFPYLVEVVKGTGNTTFYRNPCYGQYTEDDYSATLTLHYAGMADYSNFTINCGTTDYHNVCQNKVCTKIVGAGSDECIIGESCDGNGDGNGGGEYHNVCQNGTCKQVSGSGTDQCSLIGESCDDNGGNGGNGGDGNGENSVFVYLIVGVIMVMGLVGIYYYMRRT
jgi:hypothetical protein